VIALAAMGPNPATRQIQVRREQGRYQAGAGKNGCGVPVAR